MVLTEKALINNWGIKLGPRSIKNWTHRILQFTFTHKYFLESSPELALSLPLSSRNRVKPILAQTVGVCQL